MSTVELDDIAARLADGHLPTAADAEALASTYDIVSLGIVADDLRRARHGTRTTFLRVAQVSAAAVRNGDLAASPPSAREVRLEGPFVDIERAREAVRAVAAAAASIAITGFSLADLEQAASGDVSLVRRWIDELRDAGLHLIDEAPVDLLGQPAALVAAAAGAGVPVARITVHSAPAAGPLTLIRRVAALQAETDAVRVFAPIPRQAGAEPTTGYQDVKAVALARMLLTGVPHIQADWTLHGPKLAQVALTFGADDMDNVSARDEVAAGRRRTPLEEIRRNIRAAGFEAVERDSRFGIVG
jgi:aminodeoxyfutalosine synthase